MRVLKCHVHLEAAQLVIQAGALAQGGEVFLLDMGEPVKIIDLAKKMIELYGLNLKDKENPEGDIEIREIGLRPGEKLYEELLIAGEPDSTTHVKIFKAKEDYVEWKFLEESLTRMNEAINSCDQSTVIKLLHDLVPGYTSA